MLLSVSPARVVYAGVVALPSSVAIGDWLTGGVVLSVPAMPVSLALCVPSLAVAVTTLPSSTLSCGKVNAPVTGSTGRLGSSLTQSPVGFWLIVTVCAVPVSSVYSTVTGLLSCGVIVTLPSVVLGSTVGARTGTTAGSTCKYTVAVAVPPWPSAIV